MDSALELSKIDEKPKLAVSIRKAWKHFGTRKNPTIILQDVNLSIPQGIIYGLLGPSGSGKTTILNCIVGRLHVDAGEIKVFDENPTSIGFCKKQLGYMPQEVGLYFTFSVQEIIKYFGWLTNMTTEEIEERAAFLSHLLLLPDANKRIENLSGGEQRRVSLAVALLHKPRLLILDEPTVGLDSLLREAIWNHLIDLTTEDDVTVILTTHYVDETRRANTVALMRNGTILDEKPPDKLLAAHNTDTLEEVFLQLSLDQNVGPQKTALLPEAKKKSSDFGRRFLIKREHLKTLIWKNFKWVQKNALFTIVLILIPALLVLLLGLLTERSDFYISLVNHETDLQHCSKFSCGSENISCNFLDYLRRDGFVVVPFASEEEALSAVLHGQSQGMVVFQQNYTRALASRIADLRKAKSWTLEASTIHLYQDGTLKYFTYVVKRKIWDCFNDFLRDYLEDCDINSDSFLKSMKMEDPVYGSNKFRFSENAFPGMFMFCFGMHATMFTATAILSERKEGILNRSLVMGVTSTEMMLAHIISDFPVMLLQFVLVYAVAFPILDFAIKGSLVLLIFFSILNGFCSLCGGVALATFVETEYGMFFATIGSYVPVFLLSGALWPKEGMHYTLRVLYSFSHLAQAGDALRSLLQRGWDLTYLEIYRSVILSSAWCLFFLVLGFIFLKYKND